MMGWTSLPQGNLDRSVSETVPGAWALGGLRLLAAPQVRPSSTQET